MLRHPDLHHYDATHSTTFQKRSRLFADFFIAIMESIDDPNKSVRIWRGKFMVFLNQYYCLFPDIAYNL